jgi:tripartite-type tricarboxylate transporter receptor subunit TctC
MTRLYWHRWALVVVCLTSMSLASWAQSPNTRTDVALKLVLPFGPGSGTDVYARMIAAKLGHAMGTTVVIDNRPGANGVLAADYVAKAKPDGATLLLSTNTTHAANPHLVKDLRYDPVRDFSPISKLGNLTFFLLVPQHSPHQQLSQLIEAARQAPKQVGFGYSNSFGVVSGNKLGRVAGVEFLGVPYKSSPQIITDMLGGQLQFAFVDLAAAAPLVKAGRVRALAVLTDKRFALMPTVPTMRELGYTDFNVVAWFGLFAPAGTPPAVVERLNKEIQNIAQNADFRERGAELGIDVFASSPHELDVYVREQLALWARFTADAGLKPE